MAQVRKNQRLTQRVVAEYVNVSLATVRKWEDGTALPGRSMWTKVEEAMGMPFPTRGSQTIRQPKESSSTPCFS